MEDFIKVILSIALCLGMIALGNAGGETRCHQEAVDHGFAEYNPTNAHFQWKTNVVVLKEGQTVNWIKTGEIK